MDNNLSSVEPKAAAFELLPGFEDWRGNPVTRAKHGGWPSLYLLFAAQMFESMAFTSIAGNLEHYLTQVMHYSPLEAASITTNFVATCLLLSLVGGLISDSWISRFSCIIVFSVLELLASVLLIIHADYSKFQPPPCDGKTCVKANGNQVVVCMVAIYSIALGSGALRPVLLSYGGDQLDESDPKERKHLTAYFHGYFFSVCAGSVLGFTLFPWVQDNVGYKWGFGLTSTLMLLTLICISIGAPKFRIRVPQGSPLTRICQVFTAAYRKRKLELPVESALLHELGHREIKENGFIPLRHTSQFKFLDKAAKEDKRSVDADLNDQSPWYLCPRTQVEEVKLVIRVLPIFACTLVPSCILAQLHTTMACQESLHLTKGISITPTIMRALPYLIIVGIIPLYFLFSRLFAHKLITLFTPLRRIGVGFAFSILVPTLGSLLYMNHHSILRNTSKMEIFVLPQYLSFTKFLFLSEIGLLEFFYTQSPPHMHALFTSLIFASMAMGYFITSIFWTIILKIDGHIDDGYCSEEDSIETLYWVLSGLSLMNLVMFLYCSHWYRYKQVDLSSCRSMSISSMEGPSVRLPMISHHSKSLCEQTKLLEDEAGPSTSH